MLISKFALKETIDSACYNRLSSIFCINDSYYSKIDSTLVPASESPNCYYYNQSDANQEEITLTEQQITKLVESYDSEPSITQSNTPTGYKIGKTILIGTENLFNFVNSNGECESSSTAGTSSISFKMNIDFTCKNTTNSNNINLYSKIIGKNVTSFNAGTENLTIPTPDTSSFNDLTVYFIISKYGSAKTSVIKSIKIQAKDNGSTNSKTLRIRFVNPSTDINSEEPSPSFFPQIPYDIFYPIHQIAYKFSYLS